MAVGSLFEGLLKAAAAVLLTKLKTSAAAVLATKLKTSAAAWLATPPDKIDCYRFFLCFFLQYSCKGRYQLINGT